MLDICKVPPCISACKSFHGLNHYNLHIPYPLWLALITFVCWIFATTLVLSSLCTLQSCVKSLQQENTAHKTSKYHQFAATEAGFISRVTMCLLYLCFHNFTYLCAFYCCREIDFLLGNAFHERQDVDKISFELDGLKNKSISKKIAEISNLQQAKHAL